MLVHTITIGIARYFVKLLSLSISQSFKVKYPPMSAFHLLDPDIVLC